MDAFESLLVMSVTQTGALLGDLRQVIGLIAAVIAALAAARLGWHGTDRLLSRHSRTDED